MTNITIAFGRQFVIWYVFNAYFFGGEGGGLCPYKLIVRCNQNKDYVTIIC